MNISSNGAVNDNDLLIAYSNVTKTQRNEKGEPNGYVVKIFNVPNPRFSGSGLGFDVLSAHWPTNPPNNNGTTFLYANLSGFPPTPTHQLDGKLIKEEYYDNSSTLLKSVQYFYSQADYSENFYSIKVIDNRIGGFDVTGGGCGGNGAEFAYNGARRFTAFVSPAKSYHTLTDSVVEKIYHGTNYIVQKKVYGYNSFYQPEYETVYNSDGTQNITYTKTSLSFIHPSIPSGGENDALLIEQMKTSHIYDLPIEQINIRRNTTGDSLVTKAGYNVYEGTTLRKTYSLETEKPLTFRSQFIPAYYYYDYPTLPSFNVVIDSKYKLQDSAAYYSGRLIKDIISKQGKKAFIWDATYNTLLAQCVEGSSDHIAFTSFETDAKGNWSYSGTPISEATSPTGKQAYSLSNGNITKSSLDASKTYIVSYWSINGAQNVNSTTAAAGAIINGWTYYEHQVNNPAGGNISVSGSGTLDELRLYPKNSLMTTYTYEPIIGLSSQTDVNNRISYFEYDAIWRLSRVRDEKRNIVKQYEYKYGDIFQFPYGNEIQTQTFTRTNCDAGYVGSSFICEVPANKYGSFISVGDANQKALAEIVAFDGQNKVNAMPCLPHFFFETCCGRCVNPSFNLTGTGYVEFSLVVYCNGSGSGMIGTIGGPLFIPSSTRNVICTSGGNTYTVVFESDGDVFMGGPSFTGSIQLNGTYALE